jgi:hypothetical protein
MGDVFAVFNGAGGHLVTPKKTVVKSNWFASKGVNCALGR